MNCANFFFIAEFQWFLMELSVLPLRYLVKFAHWLPRFLWRIKRSHSYILLHSSLLISGFRWLCHRYLHCLPILPEYSVMYPACFLQWQSIFVVHTCEQVLWEIRLLLESMLFFSLSIIKDTFGGVFVVVESRIIFTSGDSRRGAFVLLILVLHFSIIIIKVCFP